MENIYDELKSALINELLVIALEINNESKENLLDLGIKELCKCLILLCLMKATAENTDLRNTLAVVVNNLHTQLKTIQQEVESTLKYDN